MTQTTRATSTTSQLRCITCGEPGSFTFGHSNAERDEDHPWLVRIQGDAAVWRSKLTGELVRVYSVRDVRIRRDAAVAVETADAAVEPDDLGMYLLAAVSWDEALGEPLPMLCTWRDLQDSWERTPMQWIELEVLDEYCETCGNTRRASAHHLDNMGYDYHPYTAAPADGPLACLRRILEQTYRNSPMLDDFGAWAVSGIAALRDSGFLSDRSVHVVFDNTPLLTGRMDTISQDEFARATADIESRYWRESVDALSRTIKDHPDLVERVLSGEYKGSDELLQLLLSREPHDHAKQLQHIVDEWGLNGVLQKLLLPLSDSARTDVLNAAFRGMKRKQGDSEQGVVADSTLESALDAVLSAYGLPMDGYPLVTGADNTLQRSTARDRGDRGDLASDLAAVLRYEPHEASREEVDADIVDEVFFEVGGYYRSKTGGGMLHVVARVHGYGEHEYIVAETPEGGVTRCGTVDVSANWERVSEVEWRDAWDHPASRDLRPL